MTAEIYLFGRVVPNDHWGSNGFNSKDVLNFLNENEEKDIKIYLSSEGGDYFEGVNISNLLKRHDGKVTTYVVGQASSAGSVIAMGSDEVVMDSNSSMLVHNARTMAYGTKDDFLSLSKSLEALDEGLYETYKNRFNGTDDELNSLLKEDRYLSSREALEFNLCDKIDDIQETVDNEEFLNYADNIVNESDFKVSVQSKSENELNKELKRLNEDISNIKEMLVDIAEKNIETVKDIEGKYSKNDDTFEGIFNKFNKEKMEVK